MTQKDSFLVPNSQLVSTAKETLKEVLKNDIQFCIKFLITVENNFKKWELLLEMVISRTNSLEQYRWRP